MSNWECCKCEEEVEEKDVSMMYFEMLGFQAGLVCPECNAKYITEETAIEMNKAEMEMEAKFG